MKIKACPHLVLPALVLLLLCAAAAPAQELPATGTPPAAPAQKAEKTAAEPAETEEPVELTKADRILELGSMLDEDREKLSAMDDELEKWQDYFDRLGDETIGLSERLEESRVRLQELGPDADTDEAATLTETITGLEAELELYRTQTDLLLTAETTVREQIEAMKENIALQELARDELRGLTSEPPERPAAAAAASAPPEAAPPGRSVPLPGYPVAQPAATSPERIEKRLETSEQVTALQKLERLEKEQARAEQAVVDFVKRRESLEKILLLEERLHRTALETHKNLNRALNWRREELERRRAEKAPQRVVRELKRSEARLGNLIGNVEGEIEERAAYLESLNTRLEQLGPQEGLLSGTVEDLREQVRQARDELYWLQSPLHPRNVLQWARIRGPRILLAIVATLLVLLLLRLAVRRTARLLIRRGRDARDRGKNRADTLAFSFRSAFSVLIMVGGALLVLQEAGLDIRTVLGGAAILGVAVAFGAQNLMRDYFTGFLILLEDQYELGDLITIGAITGTVESVNMRITVLRDLEGRVHFIPNGEIKAVTNRTYGWGRAVVDVPIGLHEDVDRAMATLTEAADELCADAEFGEWIEGDPVMLGVDKFTESGVVIKFMLTTRPDKMFPVRRELLRRVKKRFDEAGIEISVPHRVMVPQSPKD